MAVSPVSAALDPQRQTPYQLQVVLHVAENRFLTPIFKEQLARDLSDHLQLTLGPLAKVQVIRQHKLLPDILERGLQEPVDGWEQSGDLKTSFVLVDFHVGRYQLQARLHDGSTATASPLREQQTSDRRQVAQRAAQLITRDFGLLGTVTRTSPSEVELTIQGGDLGVSLGRWVKAGDVFAIARITQEGERRRATRLPWALLQVMAEPRDGVCRCRFFHRFHEDLSERPGVLGYRCLQLATTEAPLRLQLLDKDTLRPLDGVQVQISHKPFNGKTKPSELSTNRDGLALTREAFRQVAFVRVLGRDGVAPVAQFPVEIVDERTVVCRLKISSEAEGAASVHLRKEQWLRRIYDSLGVATERFTTLNGELKTGSLEGVLQKARGGHQALEQELTALVLERDQLVRQAAARKVTLGQLDLREGDEQMAQLRQRQKDLERFLTRLEQVIKESTSAESKALAKTLERARLLEAEADIEPALSLYEQFLDASPKQPAVKGHVEKLRAAWKPRNDAHRQAREFIYQTWPKLELASLKPQLKKASRSFAVCRDNGDVFGPRKLLITSVIHASALKTRLETLQRQDSEDNRVEARTIAEVAEGLRQLLTEVNAYLQKSSTKEHEK